MTDRGLQRTIRKIPFFLLITLLAFSAAFIRQASAQEQTVLVEARSYSGRDPAMWQGLYAASDGMVYSTLCSEMGSSHMYQYNPAADSNRIVCEPARFLDEWGKGIRISTKIHNHCVEDKQGNIYFATMNDGSGPDEIDYRSWQGGHWIKYDPREDKLTDLGLVDKGVGSYPLAIDAERNILYGVSYTGYLFSHDIGKGATRNIGRVSDWDICRDIVADDQGNVYGCFPTSRIWKYDRQRDRVFDLPVRIPFDPTAFPTQLNNPQIDRAAIWRAVEWDPVDKAVYGITCGSGNVLFKYEPHVGANGRVTDLGRMCDPKFLQPEGRQDIPYAPLSFAVDRVNRKIYFVPSAREFAVDEYVETFGSQEKHHLLMYDMEQNRHYNLGELQVSDGRRVFGCEAATVAPDGTVYICGQVETEDPAMASRRIDGIPVALHLIIYRP